METRLSWECYALDTSPAPGRWQAAVVSAIEESGKYCHSVSKYAVRIWDPAERRTRCPGSSWSYLDGFEVERVRASKRQDVLVSITMSRLFFRKGAEEPTLQPASQILEPGRYPPQLLHVPRIEALRRLVSELAGSRSCPRLRPASILGSTQVGSHVTYQFGSEAHALEDLVSAGMSKRLLNIVRSAHAVEPANVRLATVGFAKGPYAPESIGDQVAGVLRDWGCSVESYNIESQRVESLLTGARAVPVVLIALPGMRGDTPPPGALTLIRRLKTMGVSFQLCSTKSSPAYSRHGLAVSVLAKAGGRLYRCSSQLARHLEESWLVGLDLGRGNRNRGKTVAMTLTDGSGGLRAFWRAKKGEDETVPKAVLEAGLTWVKEQAGGEGHFIVLRDGTLPHNELLSTYRRVFEDRLTLVECVKSGTGLLHTPSGQPAPGTLLFPEGSDYTLLYPCVSPVAGVLTHPIKYRVAYDSMEVPVETVGSLLTALCHCATLSFQPSRLPAPIYWADGLAHVSEENLQFAGWNHLPSKTVTTNAN